MSNKYLIRIILIALVLIGSNITVYADDIINNELMDIKLRIKAIEIMLNELNEDIEKSTIMSLNASNDIIELKGKQIELREQLNSLKSQIDKNLEIIFSKYDGKIKIIEVSRTIIDAGIVLGGLYIASYSVASIKHYKEKVIKDKIEKELEKTMIKEMEKKIIQVVKDNVYSDYSRDIRSISNRLDSIEQYQPVLEALKEVMAKNE